MNWCADKFLTEAKFAHRIGMMLRRKGFSHRAADYFAERDYFIKLAKGYKYETD